MLDFTYYQQLAETSLKQQTIARTDMLRILEDADVEMFPLLHAAYKVRRQHFGNKIKIHILDNAQSGHCSEDCSYCAQSGAAGNEELSYSMKSEEELLAEARFAHDNGAFRHCIVFSGKTLSIKNIERICSVVKKIKTDYPMEICISAGFLTEEKAGMLKAAGVDRYNHNLNTSAHYYPQICTTHTYEERLNTIHIAKQHGFTLCSGVIIGMGESNEDLVSMINELQQIKPESIPVNFFIPVKGHRISDNRVLTPEDCLKILCLFRFAFPATELRIAGGREYHIRSLQPLCCYVVDSLFARGYLTTAGDSVENTKKMITDCGFELERIEF